ncbi:MAG: RDD family protein [Leptolyngbyaceae cyanobacterium bins.349]|nr:RDD family protein [Leptolyngbyaceae cyanobacterium bins.349]
MTLEDLWHQKSDRELEIAAKELDDYNEDAQQVILAEMYRRGLIETASRASVALRFPPEQSGVRYAAIGIRGVAAMIDGIILQIVGSAILIALARINEVEARALEFGIGVLIGWLYYAVLESSPYQATFGKQTVGIRVTDLHGERLSFSRATGRHFAKWLSIMSFFIGFIMAAFTKKRQALHDLLAGTVVVKQDQR